METLASWAGQGLAWAQAHYDWLVVASLGVIVGAGEIVSRHRDAPFRALLVRPALLYLLLNALASIAALGLIHGTGLGANQAAWMRILVAGLGAMILLRAAVSIGTGTDKVSVSLSTFFENFLRAADEEVKRARGQERGKVIQEVLFEKNCTFAKAREALPTVCIALHRHVPEDEQTRLVAAIRGLQSQRARLTDRQKLRVLGYELLDVVGAGVLRAAVQDLGDEIIGETELTAVQRSELVRKEVLDRGISFDKARFILPKVCLSLSPYVPDEAKEDVHTITEHISKSDFTDRQKLILLCYALLDVVDSKVLKSAVGDLGSEILESEALVGTSSVEAPSAANGSSSTS